MGGTAFDRIEEQVLAKRSALVLGLDPRPEQMPEAYRVDPDGVTRFHERLLDLLAPRIVAVKPQIAFFECLGVDGLRLWARTCEAVRRRGLVVIGDVKRGDVGSTAAAYARAHFEWADILTVNPYLGDDAIEPFLAPCREAGKGIFVLCVTSNPGWHRFQAREDAGGRPLFLAVADAIAEWNEAVGDAGRGPVGAVVGATQAAVIEAVRSVLPAAWLLMPGVGAQGARISDLGGAFASDGTGCLLPVSRGLAGCFDPDDAGWEERVEEQAGALLQEMRDAVPALSGA